MQESELKQIVQRVVTRALGEVGPAGSTSGPGPSSAGAPVLPEWVTMQCLERWSDGNSIPVAANARVTPLVEEELKRRNLKLVHQLPGGASSGALRVAVGCDHGGWSAKGLVLELLRDLGHQALDLGTHDERPVDYPDIASSVARSVVGPNACADLGICIDGAGIGSAMAANKVQGARAATCWNEASARNAREHNYANVLCLGARQGSQHELAQIVRTFLSTPHGPERHARRVAKIHALER